MKKLTLPGFWYCDALPNGSYVASRFDNSLTNYNEVYFLQHKLIWTVIGPDGFAGSGHFDPFAWEWKSNWFNRGINAGLHAVSYDKDNNLVVIHESTGSNPTGALGYRYLDDDGNLVSTVDTYSPVQPLGVKYGIKDLWEFTIRDNGKLILGQGETGVIAVIDGKHRVDISKLINNEVQNARDVNFHKNGDSLSISWYFYRSPTDYTSCFVWLTVQELRALIAEEPIPVPVGDTMIPAFERPMWQAPYFSHHIRYGDTPLDKHVGNAIAVIGDERDENVRDSELARISKLGQPMIVDIGTHPPNDIYLNLTVAWLAAGGNISQLVDNVARALTYAEKPVIAYLDGDVWTDNNPFNSDRVWPSIQAYRGVNETLNQFKFRVDGVIKQVASYKLPMCLVSRFDDFNGSSSIARTLECMPIYKQWLRDYYFVAHMPFADRRGNGISSNPELWNQARAFQYAIPFERPNRFDYWVPSGSDILTILKNKLGQSRASVVLEPYLREDILRRYL